MTVVSELRDNSAAMNPMDVSITARTLDGGAIAAC